MKSMFLGAAAVAMAGFASSAFAEEEAAPAPAPMSASGCAMTMVTPVIPDGATASEAELVETQGQIKAFQAALVPYRECLDAVTDNERGKKLEERQAALDAYNASVDVETKLVEDWTATVTAFQAR